MAVPNTMIYFTLYDQLKVMYGFVEGQENVWSPMCAGITARSKNCILYYVTSVQCGMDIFLSLVNWYISCRILGESQTEKKTDRKILVYPNTIFLQSY